MIIDNRPGGAATIGMDLTAKAAPDGYTVGVANVAFGVNPFALRKLPYSISPPGPHRCNTCAAAG